MTYTGGTTGRPKGVLASHRNRAVTAHTVMVEEALDERDVVGIVTPLFHVAALNIMFQPAVLAGATSTFLANGTWAISPHGARDAHDGGLHGADPDRHGDQRSGFRRREFCDLAQAQLRRCADARLGADRHDGEAAGGEAHANLRPVRDGGPDFASALVPAGAAGIGRAASLQRGCGGGRPERPAHQAGEIGEVVSRGENVMLEYYNEPEQTKALLAPGGPGRAISPPSTKTASSRSSTARRT